MPKFNRDTLEDYRNALQKEFAARKSAKITVHMGTCGLASGAEKVKASLLREITRKKMSNVRVTSSGCAGLCSREPMITVEIAGQPPVKYVEVNEKNIITILHEHVLGGAIVEENALAVGCERTW